VGDLNRFLEAVATHRLLRADTLQQLITGGVTPPMANSFIMISVAQPRSGALHRP
jgi:hypothetical protein